ncbi:TraR/DksA family transcriptional regulator [Candidatus Nitronereus thalassa]|uniref:TraR/DksA family transcriptional regulator n=1 Tax=Candidatus Nitronereus thalassa TaxID=3020898 RepID=A0ABU3K4Z8_9BACT|nr:TraR/DksA family transcriptional regulator [Candidatus Nitronereus thalassa]MDT7041477.1 TraR/DksA family transcriptional regulator [Candidatus Nitronereus thalassa]
MKAKPAKKTTAATSKSTKAGSVKTAATKTSKAVAKRTPSSKPVTKSSSEPKSKPKPKTKAESSSPRPANDVATQTKRPVVLGARAKALRTILLAKRDAVMKQMREQLGQSLTDDQQRRLESAMDSGDQALFDLEREMGISLQEMRNRERQMIEEALSSLDEGTYGKCAECDAEISEKRLAALPFARYCIECQSRMELLEKIEKGEQRI